MLGGRPGIRAWREPQPTGTPGGPSGDTWAMRTHVALLRGINVGGNNRLPMTELRAAAEELGWSDVVTYIQSGNVAFSSRPGTGKGRADNSCDELADRLEEALASRCGVRCQVVVVAKAELAAAAAGNPFPQVTDAKALHVGFRRAALTPEEEVSVRTAVDRAVAKGSRDELAWSGPVLYLHTPDGLGRSILAGELARAAGWRPATARNWATVTKLLELLVE